MSQEKVYLCLKLTLPGTYMKLIYPSRTFASRILGIWITITLGIFSPVVSQNITTVEVQAKNTSYIVRGIPDSKNFLTIHRKEVHELVKNGVSQPEQIGKLSYQPEWTLANEKTLDGIILKYPDLFSPENLEHPHNASKYSLVLIWIISRSDGKPWIVCTQYRSNPKGEFPIERYEAFEKEVLESDIRIIPDYRLPKKVNWYPYLYSTGRVKQ